MILALLTVLACGPGGTDSGTADSDPFANWDERPIADRCFPGIGDTAKGLPDYDQFDPKIAHHCQGTDHQDIVDVERLVFLGDSVTAGTPPTTIPQLYRSIVEADVKERFGDEVIVENCAVYGARTDDLLLEPNKQILECLGETDPIDERTLVVMTIGGNDMFAFAEDMRDGASGAEVLAEVENAADLMHDAISWFGENEASRFPNGVDVIFGNVYEFTDTVGDMDSCPTAELFGFTGTIPELRDAYLRINERFVQTAVETQTDVIFMLEHFCGHGFHADDPDNECYRGPDTELYFDPTCIHPTPAGHARIAEMFTAVIDE